VKPTYWVPEILFVTRYIVVGVILFKFQVHKNIKENPKVLQYNIKK